jgi:hypothetical protein
LIPEWSKLQSDVAALRDSIAGVRGKFEELSAPDTRDLLESVRDCSKELIALRAALHERKVAIRSSP